MKNKNLRRKIKNYNLIMAVLSLIVAIILLLELILDLKPITLDIFYLIDFIIWIIFVWDYFFRLYRSKNKKKFIKKNIVDLISIIPIYSIFRVFRALNILKVARISKVSKLSKTIRLLSISKKSKKNFEIFITTNNFNYTILIAISIILLGSILISLVEKIKLGEALWWCIVTVTTVGYGDIYPVTPLGRVIAAIVMVTGIGFIGSLTSTISTYFTNREKDKKLMDNKDCYNKVIIERIIDRLENFDNISSEEVEEIYKLLIFIKGKSAKK